MIKILVTGASGFLGTYVINWLLKRDIQIIATSGSEVSAKNKEWFGNVVFRELDLSTLDTDTNYFEYFGKPDICIHLAWKGLPAYQKEFHLTENLPQQLAFLTNLVSNGLKNLTIAGTCLEYGMKEGELSEDIICEPTVPYAIAKNELRIQLERICEINNVSFKWVRLFYMYGKGQNPNSLISQLDKALEENEKEFNISGGEQIRDFLPVEKVADYLVRIALSPAASGIINCCSGNPVKVKDFVNDYLQSVNRTISLNLGYYKYTDYEPMTFWGDNKKLKLILSL